MIFMLSRVVLAWKFVVARAMEIAKSIPVARDVEGFRKYLIRVCALALDLSTARVRFRTVVCSFGPADMQSS